jgi:hypothetical protein
VAASNIPVVSLSILPSRIPLTVPSLLNLVILLNGFPHSQRCEAARPCEDAVEHRFIKHAAVVKQGKADAVEVDLRREVV